MIREIKFRAWDLDTKIMIHPYQLEFCQNGLKIRTHTGGYGGTFQTHNHATLMQYTGLKDRFGNEVYEADILDGGEDLNRIGVVFWNEDYGHWAVTWKHRPRDRRRKIEHYTKPLSMDIFVAQVLGNIYEKPELVEERLK